MARLPDIPIQSYLDDQVKRFQESTSGYFDALEFDLGARDAESQIPTDYPLPGGPDQWDEAERQNLEAAEKRRQEEEERRRLEQVAQEQARLAQAEEQRRAQAEAGAMEMARKLGIQTPDQAFSSFLGMAQRPRDNLSSVLFDRDSPLPGRNTEGISNPEQPSNPVSDFMSWASGYGGPTPDPASSDRDPPRDNTSSMAFNEPAPVRERGYFEPTETERNRLSGAWEGTKNAEPVGPEFLPGAVRQGLGYGLGALETAEAVTDPIRARLDPRVWTFARNGVMAEKLPDEFARMNDLMGAARPDGSQKLELTPEEQAELRRLEQLRETLYQGIKDDPDALSKYAQADPAYHLTTAVTDTAMIPAAGGMAKGLASGGARALGAGARTAERAGYVADVVAQSVLDPTNLLTQPAVDVAARGIGAAARGGRNLLRGADAAAEAAEQAPGVVHRGSGVVPEARSSPSPAMEAVEAVRTANLVTPERMVSLIGDRPEYLADVAQHILDQRRKVRDGTLTVRDTAKAYYMTLASQGADAIKVATVESKVPGFTVPENFWSAERAVDGSPIVRPEEAAAAWLFTPKGQQALDDLEQGVLNREAWREGQAVRAAFGDDRFRTNNVFSERAPVNGRTQFNMDSIQAWTDRFNDLARSGATPEQLMVFSKRLNGISEAKGPFLNHALGFGESPTIDAVEISAWLTGQGDVSRLSGKAADLKRQIDLQLKDKRVGAALGERIGQQFAEMRRLLPPEATADLPDEVFNHVLHHWIWDRMKGSATTHEGFYNALQRASGVAPGAARGLRAPAFNAAQGAVFGAASENLQAQAEGRDVDTGEQLRRGLLGGALGVAAGSRAARSLGRRALGSGVVPAAGDDAARSLDSKLIETIDVIRGMRRVGAPEDIVESWERSLAQNSNLTLDAIQGLTKSAHPELLEAEIKAARQAAEAAGLDPAWTMPKQYPTPSRAPAGGVGPSPSPTVTPMSPIPDSTYTPPGPPVTSASAHTPQLPKSGSVQGSPDSVRQAHENFARLKAQREAKKTKPISDPDVGYILGALQKFKAGGPDRHARLSAISRYLQKKGPLPPELDAWKLARLYPGNKQAWQDAQEKLIKPALSAVKPEHQDLVSDTMKQLDALDIDNNLPDKVQGRLLNTAPEGKAPVGEVRREGEAVLESQRARANLSATEREYVRAQAERDALLQEMEQAGEGPTRSEGSYKQGRNGVPGGPAPESAMETERFTRRADQLEQANIRVETARARRDDASRIVSERIKQSQVKRTDAKLERAATRAQEVRSERKYTAGITPTDAEGVYTALREQIGEADADKVIAAIQATFKARDLGRDMLYQSGLIDQAQLDYLVKNFPHYSPIRYLDMINQAEGQVTKGKSFSVGSSPIKKLTEGGSDLESMDSVQATSEMLARTYDLAARNKVMRAVDGWADDPVLSQLVKRIDEAKDLPDVQDWQTKSVYKDGEKQLLAVRNEIADALDLSSPAIPGFIGKFFRFFSGHARTAFTTANPKFLAANAVLDAINFMHREMVNSPGVFGVGKESNPLRIGADLAEGYWASLGSRKLATRAGAGAWAGAQAQATASSRDQEDDPYYWHKVGAAGLLGAGAGAAVRATKGQRALMERMSAAGATIGQRSRFTKPEDVVRQLRGENIVVRTLSDDPGIIGAFKRKGEQIADLGGLIWDRPLAEIGAISESAPRIAAFKRAERQGKSQADAAMAARRISVDFDAGGKWAKQINDVVPFFNARVQGLVETADDFKKHPFKSAMAMTGIVGSLVALEIYNRTVAPEAYKDVSEYTKHHGAVVMSDKPPEGKGKWELAFLPLRGTAGSLVPLVSEAMSAAYGDDPKTWQELAWKTGVATFDQFSPIPADPEGLSSLAMLPVVGPTVSTMANYDLFRGEPIVSRSQQTLPTTEQYTDRTSQTARRVGRALGWSPTKIDWWVKNALGGPGEQAMSTADAFIHKAGADLPTTERDIPKGARDVPFFGPIAGRFLRTVGSERQNKAYERAEAVVARLGPQMVAELEADPDYQAATPDKQKQLLRSAQSKLEETAREMAGVPEFAEPKDLGLPPRFQGVEVGSPLEQEILKALSTPEQYRTQRQHSLAFQYKTSSSQYLDVSRRQRKESERLRQNVGDLVTGQSVR